MKKKKQQQMGRSPLWGSHITRKTETGLNRVEPTIISKTQQ